MGREFGSPPKSNRMLLGPRPTLPKISSKSVLNFLRYFSHGHTDGQTHRQLIKHNLFSGDNKGITVSHMIPGENEFPKIC